MGVRAEVCSGGIGHSRYRSCRRDVQVVWHKQSGVTLFLYQVPALPVRFRALHALVDVVCQGRMRE